MISGAGSQVNEPVENAQNVVCLKMEAVMFGWIVYNCKYTRTIYPWLFGFFAISVATFSAGVGDEYDDLVQEMEEMDLLQNVHPSGA